MRPSNKAWSLTVRKGSLHLDAPHGSFEVRGIAPAVMPVVQALPDGTEVECEGSFDGGGTITHLVVTKVRRIHKDLTGRVLQLPDAVVAADSRLARARARHHFAAGHVDKAAADVRSLLELGDDLAIAEYEQLPAEYRVTLNEALIAWQAARAPSWRALKYITLERWTDAHIDQAVEHGLANGGVFGAAPGVRVEELLAELERRKLPTKSWTRQTQRLRRAQATEGDTVHRFVTELELPRVVGADLQGVYVAGGNELVHYALDGSELKRWSGLVADRVVEGVALQLEADEPAGVRLSDGKELYRFAHRIARHDGELLWGIHMRDPEHRKMRSEIRHIATGYTIAELAGWVDDVAWSDKHIFVRGERPQTLTREGRLVRAEVPPPPETIEIENANGRHVIPAAHAPWRFGPYDSTDAGGWIVHGARTFYVAPSEPGASWVQFELAKEPARVELAPPWLAVRARDGAITLIALAELMSAGEIRIGGKWFARRSKDDPRLEVPAAFSAFHDKLVELGVTPSISAVERDVHLHRVLAGRTALPEDALAVVLADHAPACVVHDYDEVDEGDAIYARLSAAFGDDHLHIREVERVLDGNDATLTLEVSRAGKTVRRRCSANRDAVIVTIDKLASELDVRRRIFAIPYAGASFRHPYLVITPEQRRGIVAAGYEGIRAGARP